jgi:drug/metabolite transporter (DMT)-like permease
MNVRSENLDCGVSSDASACTDCPADSEDGSDGSSEDPASSEPESIAALTEANNRSAAIWMICGAVSFTFMGGMANILGTKCDWRIVAQCRTIFSFLAAVALARAAGASFVIFRPKILWVRSIAGTISLISTFYALTHLPIADVLTLTNTYPLWIVAIGFVAWGESVEGSILTAIVSAIIGVVLIQQPHMGGDRFALFAALAAACFTAMAMMGLNRLGNIDPRAVVAHFSAVASIAIVPLLFIGHPADFGALHDPVTILLLAGVGITGTIGQIFLTKAYAAGSAPRVAVVAMSQVAMALVFDTIYRGKLPPSMSLAGMMFVVAPVIWVMLRGKGRSRPGRSASSLSAASGANPSNRDRPTSPVSAWRGHTLPVSGETNRSGSRA